MDKSYHVIGANLKPNCAGCMNIIPHGQRVCDGCKPALKAFEFNQWHAWQGTRGIMLSDESAKVLKNFATADDAINYLYLSAGDKPAARALNAHMKNT